MIEDDNSTPFYSNVVEGNKYELWETEEISRGDPIITNPVEQWPTEETLADRERALAWEVTWWGGLANCEGDEECLTCNAWCYVPRGNMGRVRDLLAKAELNPNNYDEYALLKLNNAVIEAVALLDKLIADSVRVRAAQR